MIQLSSMKQHEGTNDPREASHFQYTWLSDDLSGVLMSLSVVL